MKRVCLLFVFLFDVLQVVIVQYTIDTHVILMGCGVRGVRCRDAKRGGGGDWGTTRDSAEGDKKRYCKVREFGFSLSQSTNFSQFTGESAFRGYHQTHLRCPTFFLAYLQTTPQRLEHPLPNICTITSPPLRSFDKLQLLRTASRSQLGLSHLHLYRSLYNPILPPTFATAFLRTSSTLINTPQRPSTSLLPRTAFRSSHTMSLSSDPWDCLYNGMLPFHEHFRHTLSQITTLLETLSPTSPSKNKPNNLANLLYLSTGLCQHLEGHHTIEERFIFPTLAKKLPQFGHSSQHIKEHEKMHKALDNLEKYIGQVSRNLRSGKVKNGELEEVFDYEKMKKLVEGLREVLLPHLAAEEASLRAPVVKEAGFQLSEIKNLIR